MAEFSILDREAIKYARLLRANCKQCPQCGAVTCIGDDHIEWHQAVKQYVDDLRADAVAAIQAANDRTDQVRTDATAAIQSLNTKVTNLTARVSALEVKVGP
jgi:UDP-N-acetylmuramoylalanine-D-glutamate ligase